MAEEIISLAGLKEADFYDFVKYAVFQVLKSQLEDVSKFVLAVENVESLLIDQLDDEYFEKIKQKHKELINEYGTRTEEDRLKISSELARFKFRELVKFIKKRIPEEVEGVL